METVIVTGASRGIGLALSGEFASRQFRVIATYRGEPTPELEALATTAGIEALPLEVTDQSSIDQFSGQLAGRQIDILINNAGIIGPKDQSLEGIDANAWLETFSINTIAPLRVTRSLLEGLKKSPNPRVLTISSQMGALSSEGSGMYAYRSSKSAVNKVVQLMARELKDQNIALCAVHPGWVQTDMGGPNADITPAQSAQGLADLAMKLDLKDTGQFYTWEGVQTSW